MNAEAEAPTEEPSPTEAKAANEEAPAEQAEQAAGEGQFPPEVDIYVLLSSMIGMLHGFAWQKMRLVADQKTGQVEEDLPQANRGEHRPVPGRKTRRKISEEQRSGNCGAW